MASSTTTTIMPVPDLDRPRGLEHVGRAHRVRRPVVGVVLADQRGGVGADGAGDAADVAAGVEIAAAGGEVIVLDVPDDRFPDPGLLADLGNGETGLTACVRQGFTDAHAAPPHTCGGDEALPECGGHHQV
jgi:hypothetical protein